MSALSLLQRLQRPDGKETRDHPPVFLSQERLAELVRWLVWKQSTLLNELMDLNEDDDSLSGGEAHASGSATSTAGLDSLSAARAGSPYNAAAVSSVLLARGECLWAGFSGRSNKPCDTCYSFWAGGSLSVSAR